MIARVKSQAIMGIEAHFVDVEVDIATNGLPGFSIVGLPDVVVKESRDRIKAALRNSGFEFPSRKIVVNLAPANIRKGGPSFDLPMALAILIASKQLGQANVVGMAFCGELSLDGSLRPIRGALPMAEALAKNGINSIVLPKENAREAAVVKDATIYPVRSLLEAYSFLKGEFQIQPTEMDISQIWEEGSCETLDFADVKGQSHVKRGLEIAAAGGHNVLLIGPPGAGKTMLARRLPTILPKMTLEEAIQSTKIHSVAGLIKPNKTLVATRPFRAPHHTISYAGLVGGGSYPRPGEISLAHNGVLFLDEFPEFRRDALEALRQPMEDGTLTISRISASSIYPARFMLVAAMNPCPCGFFTDPKRVCHCTPPQIQRYLSKISGPLLDRIDIHLEVPSLNYKELSSRPEGESSSAIRQRVNAARRIQQNRYQGSATGCNAHLESKAVEAFCPLEEDAKELLKKAILELGLSARAYHKILKVARTIADLSSSQLIGPEHICEAIQYRCLDRNLWT